MTRASTARAPKPGTRDPSPPAPALTAETFAGVGRRLGVSGQCIGLWRRAGCPALLAGPPFDVDAVRAWREAQGRRIAWVTIPDPPGLTLPPARIGRPKKTTTERPFTAEPAEGAEEGGGGMVQGPDPGPRAPGPGPRCRRCGAEKGASRPAASWWCAACADLYRFRTTVRREALSMVVFAAGGECEAPGSAWAREHCPSLIPTGPRLPANWGVSPSSSSERARAWREAAKRAG